MKTFLFLTLILAAVVRTTQAQAVFAHVVMGNNDAYQLSDWESDITLAASKGIDAFVLNICPPLADTLRHQLDLVFTALESPRLNTTGFKVFFSFDYLGSGTPWDTYDIKDLLGAYGGLSGYFKVDGKPLVSTFEGPSNSNVDQWTAIRASMYGGIHFVPDWTSKGPGYRMDLINGAFNWNMWPDGPTNATAHQDEEWLNKLRPANKTYMMGISPWFYTNLPGYNKAWVWRGDSLWYDRWEAALNLKPDFIEIVTWNDFGESHYIGPIRAPGIPSTPNADARPYVDGFPHTAWLETLPHQIAAYKHAVNPASHPAPVVNKDKVVFWYRTTPVNDNNTGGVTGNACPSSINTGGYQQCYPVSEILEDGIFAIALLSQPTTVTIGVGDNTPQSFNQLSKGINFLSRPFNGETGAVSVALSNGTHGHGVAITSQPANGTNFNAWVGHVEDSC